MKPLTATLLISLLPAALPAGAGESIPPRKAGLWEIATEASMIPGQKMMAQRCVGPDGDGDVLDPGARERKKCTPPRISRAGSAYVTDMTCTVQGSTATIHGTVSGDFQNQYSGRIDTTYAPPLHGLSSSSMVIAARWLGPCPAGQKPGDTVLSTPGGRLNLKDVVRGLSH